jgi:asparagine synthase (glutamine-hydrolysing)
MCGICGIAARSDPSAVTAELLSAMCGSIEHRGPDDEGRDVQHGVGLGIRRLAVIDVAGGKQPYYNEDRSVRAVFNGEIYNFQKLRRELELRGHRFNSGADGEVIVHLWEEYGSEFPSHLNGMFAIAVHDARKRRLLLVRDRVGIKPLFYYQGGEGLVFGSEVKAILASRLLERRLDVDALGQFLAWEYVPAPHTLLEGVFKLEPGTLLDLDLSSFSSRKKRWWELPAPGSGLGLPDAESWVDEVDEKVGEAVRRRLVADVPLGAFLSGGVDSSLVVSHMGPTKAFSIGFDEGGYSEVEWARRVADHLGIEHRVEFLEPEISDLFDHLMYFMDDPIGDFSIFPTYLISKYARSEVTVALSGDGGDELFGGYETYIAQERARLWRRVPSVFRRGVVEPLIASMRPRPQKKGLVNKAKRFVEGLEHPSSLEHARWRLFVGEALGRQLFTQGARRAMHSAPEAHIEALFEAAAERSEVDRGLYVDVNSYLVDNCLVKVDRMSMACSLEVRVPLLDHELVELAFRIPSSLKVRGGETKPLLKEVTARRVPSKCVYRPKEGFSMPMKHWLRGPLRPLMEDLLSSDRVRKEGVFRADTVDRLKTEHVERRANHSHVLWSLMVFQDWRQRWKV